MSIPKLLHIIWIGDESKRPEECIASWRRLNPGFAFRLWGNRELEETGWRLGELIRRWLPREINGAADVMRWEILFAHGGVAVDADSVCLRPLEDWLLEAEVFAAFENEVVRPGLIATGALGAVPGHPFIGQIIQDIQNDPDPLGGMAWQKVGPGRITDTYRQHKDAGLTIYPSHYFIPEHYSGVVYQGTEPVFARQMWGSTRGLYGNRGIRKTEVAQTDDAVATSGSLVDGTTGPVVPTGETAGPVVPTGETAGPVVGAGETAGAVVGTGETGGAVVGTAGKVKVSLCMIVKNEEGNLAACLECCADLVDEIVLVDTGSTDGTKEIAGRFGARVFDFPWQDSFAAARNESIRHATGQWIFWMDADDRIDEENRQKLRRLFGGLKEEMAAYLLTCRVLPSGSAPSPLAPLPRVQGRGESGTGVRLVDHTRVFPNHPKVRWSYRVHEQILPAVMRLGGAARRTDIAVTHVGYQDEGLSQAKLQRNLRLMEMDNQEHPGDPFILYNLGRAYERLGRLAEAVPLWERSLANTAPHETYVAKLYYLLCQTHYQQGQRGEALQACLAGLARFPGDVELLMLASNMMCDAGDLRAAEACLLRLLQMPRDGITLGDDPGLRSFKARCQLGRIYRDQKRLTEAQTQWRAAVEENPDYAQAWLGLGQVFLDQNRWGELEEIVSRLEANPAGAVEAAVLRGLRLAVTRETALARKLMEETIANHPRAIEPRVLLGRLLMRDGQDGSAAANVFQEILRLDPAHGEARRNLNTLEGRKQAGQLADGVQHLAPATS